MGIYYYIVHLRFELINSKLKGKKMPILSCPATGCERTFTDSSTKFCTEHGAKLQPLPKCNHCETEIRPNHKHCGGCGLPRNSALHSSPNPPK